MDMYIEFGNKYFVFYSLHGIQLMEVLDIKYEILNMELGDMEFI